MDKEFALRKAGGEVSLAKLLGISRQAVSQWGERMPQLQLYRLKEMRPKWFAEFKREQGAVDSRPASLDEAKADA